MQLINKKPYGGYGNAVVTHSTPTSEVGGSNHAFYVRKLLLALRMVSSLQYRTLTNYMYWFPLPTKLPVVISPVQCWKRHKTANKQINQKHNVMDWKWVCNLSVAGEMSVQFSELYTFCVRCYNCLDTKVWYIKNVIDTYFLLLLFYCLMTDPLLLLTTILCKWQVNKPTFKETMLEGPPCF